MPPQADFSVDLSLPFPHLRKYKFASSPYGDPHISCTIRERLSSDVNAQSDLSLRAAIILHVPNRSKRILRIFGVLAVGLFLCIHLSQQATEMMLCRLGLIKKCGKGRRPPSGKRILTRKNTKKRGQSRKNTDEEKYPS